MVQKILVFLGGGWKCVNKEEFLLVEQSKSPRFHVVTTLAPRRLKKGIPEKVSLR